MSSENISWKIPVNTFTSPKLCIYERCSTNLDYLFVNQDAVPWSMSGEMFCWLNWITRETSPKLSFPEVSWLTVIVFYFPPDVCFEIHSYDCDLTKDHTYKLAENIIGEKDEKKVRLIRIYRSHIFLPHIFVSTQYWLLYMPKRRQSIRLTIHTLNPPLSPVRYSHFSILPRGNAYIFAASLLISYCNFLFLILFSIVINTFYICS